MFQGPGPRTVEAEGVHGPGGVVFARGAALAGSAGEGVEARVDEERDQGGVEKLREEDLERDGALGVGDRVALLEAREPGRDTRRVRLVRGEGRGVST
jgi:hypothetical protein